MTSKPQSTNIGVLYGLQYQGSSVCQNITMDFDSVFSVKPTGIVCGYSDNGVMHIQSTYAKGIADGILKSVFGSITIVSTVSAVIEYNLNGKYDAILYGCSPKLCHITLMVNLTLNGN